MMRLEDCCTRCHVHDCRTIVCLDDDPSTRCDACGEVTCVGCPVHECAA